MSVSFCVLSVAPIGSLVETGERPQLFSGAGDFYFKCLPLYMTHLAHAAQPVFLLTEDINLK